MTWLWQRKGRVALVGLLALIVLAHVGLWRSDQMTTDLKWRLTVINALGWLVVLGPIWLVGKWLDAKTGRDTG